MGRPVGSFGEIAKALLIAAQDGPADVRTLAARSQVGHLSAKVTVSRLVSRGYLVKDDAAVLRGCKFALPAAVLRGCKFALPAAASANASQCLAAVLAAWTRDGNSIAVR